MNLVARVRAILVTPKTEWPIIAREPGDPQTLFLGYVAILAAIPAVCGLVGWVLVGAPLGTSILIMVLWYVLNFVAVYLGAMIIDALAPTFEGEKSSENALKLATYSATPIWLSGIFLLVPGLGFLLILGLYGVYLLWTGIVPLMRVPEEKRLGYTGAIVACAVAVGILLAVAAGLLGMRRPF
jgi:hypothetical protein